MNTTSLYPLKFHPILKEKIWGGNKLHTILGKDSKSNKIGESWELSAVEHDTSITSNGALNGTSLNELVLKFKDELLGKKNYQRFGNKFPLLIKFIDAREDLSIQLHPNDELAKKRHNSFGKTEMWYVMQANKDANLIVGFNKNVNEQTYLQHLNNKTLPQILNFDNVKEGDTYFIEVGRVHAIGAGVMLAEIQQTSDITYRIYDWDRVDTNGKSRELHNDLAIDAIDFDMKDDFRVNYSKTKNVSNEMVSCPYFTTNYLHISSKVEKTNDLDSFIIYMCVKGLAEIHTSQSKTTIQFGETLLMPASINVFSIVAEDATLLEVYV